MGVMLKNAPGPIDLPVDNELPRRHFKIVTLTQAKLDRLSWTTELGFSAYGLRFNLRTNDASVLEKVQEHLPYGWQPSTAPALEPTYSLCVGQPAVRRGIRPYHLLYFGNEQLARSEDFEGVLKRLETHSQLYVGEHNTRRVFVHAGVVGWQGQAIVIPGRSYTGKSSLVAALLQVGASYYSDEYALLDDRGRVWPYPIDISLRARDQQPKRKVEAAEFGADVGAEPLPVGLVVVSNYQTGANWQPRQLTPGRAILALLDNTVAARSNPPFVIPILGRVASQAQTLKSPRGEAAAVAETILSQIGSNSYWR